MISLAFWGRSVLGCQKVLWNVPHHFFKLVSEFLNSFLHFSPTALALGSSTIVKVLGQNDASVFLGSLQQMAFPSQNVLRSVPQTVPYICLTVSCGFWANGCCFRKGSVEGSANYSLHLSSKWLLLHKSSLEAPQPVFTFISQCPPGVKVA